MEFKQQTFSELVSLLNLDRLCTMHYDTGLCSVSMEKIAVDEAVFKLLLSDMNLQLNQEFFCRKYPLLA